MKLVALVIVLAGLLVGCGGSGEDRSASTAPVASPPSPVQVPVPTTPADDKPGLAAAEIVAAFTAARLPVRHARNNSKNCVEQELGCLEMISSDDLTITTWGDAVAMEAYAQAFGPDAFVLRNVVLQYAAARTPAAARPKYQLELTRLAG